MFEKFSVSDVDASGSGGEYTVQAGFGWTNGVALWAAANYGKVLAAPVCPDVATEASLSSGDASESGASPTTQRSGLVASIIAVAAGLVVALA